MMVTNCLDKTVYSINQSLRIEKEVGVITKKRY